MKRMLVRLPLTIQALAAIGAASANDIIQMRMATRDLEMKPKVSRCLTGLNLTILEKK